MRIAFAVLCLPLASVAQATPATELCGSFEDVADHVATTGKAVHIAAWLDPEVFACGPTNEHNKPFCDAAVAASGLEFAHIFPWLLRDCIKLGGRISAVELSNDWTGLRSRKRIVHLSGYLRGSAVDLRYVPSPDDRGKFNIYGKYSVTIWRP